MKPGPATGAATYPFQSIPSHLAAGPFSNQAARRVASRLSLGKRALGHGIWKVKSRGARLVKNAASKYHQPRVVVVVVKTTPTESSHAKAGDGLPVWNDIHTGRYNEMRGILSRSDATRAKQLERIKSPARA